jgi:catechol 2,3-dioxygenase-like lactoylglutathione lyase family enzyme
VPALTGIIESCLYIEDVDRAGDFYEKILGLRRIAGDNRFLAYSVADRDVLLLFKKGGATEPLEFPGGIIPPHDGSGHNHLAFSVSAEELAAWERKLAEQNVAIESRVQWPAGGKSIYFRDPDENLLEIATPGLWSIY